ncbi:MAG: hypothetical protein PHG91_08680 [Syntrophales bacterium]|mgnify:CR=1 FL=1|nr:hypothetical protein [Syntrophales bacterium]MDD5233457.1 hypothetical protein [Syntrophales bacterium]MDD5532774.1 hypothetical protein [Syntrophales bacterium]HPL64020.1 hypothetical protein [Syntrophales bacterium]
MGEKLVRIFEIVTEQTGLKGRLELASRTGISMKEAMALKDTEELVEKFKYAATDIYDSHYGRSK